MGRFKGRARRLYQSLDLSSKILYALLKRLWCSFRACRDDRSWTRTGAHRRSRIGDQNEDISTAGTSVSCVASCEQLFALGIGGSDFSLMRVLRGDRMEFRPSTDPFEA